MRGVPQWKLTAIFGIILMIFVDEHVSVSCVKIGILYSYLFDHDNVSERENKLELQTNFDF